MIALCVLFSKPMLCLLAVKETDDRIHNVHFIMYEARKKIVNERKNLKNMNL